MMAKNKAGEVILAVPRFFGRLGDDDVIIDDYGNVAGKNKIGDGVKKDVVIGCVISAD